MALELNLSIDYSLRFCEFRISLRFTQILPQRIKSDQMASQHETKSCVKIRGGFLLSDHFFLFTVVRTDPRTPMRTSLLVGWVSVVPGPAQVWTPSFPPPYSGRSRTTELSLYWAELSFAPDSMGHRVHTRLAQTTRALSRVPLSPLCPWAAGRAGHRHAAC